MRYRLLIRAELWAFGLRNFSRPGRVSAMWLRVSGRRGIG